MNVLLPLPLKPFQNTWQATLDLRSRASFLGDLKPEFPTRGFVAKPILPARVRRELLAEFDALHESATEANLGPKQKDRNS